MKEKVKFDWLELIIGILLVVLGIFSLSQNGFALSSFVIVYGVAAIFTGIMDIVLYVSLERKTGFGPTLSLVSGIFSIIAGLLLVFNIPAGQLAIVFVFPLWFIAHCISRLSTLSLTRILVGDFAYYFSLILNILGIIIGIFMIFSPSVTFFAIEYMIGAFLIISGVASVVDAIAKYFNAK